MVRWLTGLTVLALVVYWVPLRAADDEGDDENSAKSALQELNDFIGDWKGSGGPEKPRPQRGETWEESVSWSWKFKGDDAWLTMTIKDGRHLKSGELRYLTDKKVYQLTAVDKNDKKQVYQGKIKDGGYLTLERADPKTKETQRLTMNTAGDGIRFIYKAAHKAEGRTLFTKDYQVACTKEGEALGAKEKKVECVVSGGLGTIPVSYKGMTYYVCCSGCRDAFNENPEKYIKQAEARKKKK
jgi:hypothetical protein